LTQNSLFGRPPTITGRLRSAGYWFAGLRWAVYRAYKRAAYRRIERLIAKHRWHGTVLDTQVPNAPCLRVKSLIVINSYGQERIIR
jgi:hypothetical protein